MHSLAQDPQSSLGVAKAATQNYKIVFRTTLDKSKVEGIESKQFAITIKTP